LEHEKEVTGMFMSGHPLDHFKFEIKHYGITPLSEVEHLMTDEDAVPSANRLYKLAGLVTTAQERTTKAGKNFGNLTIEDYTGKLEITLWSNDYARFQNFFKPGYTIYMTGNIKPRMRYNGPEQVQDGWEFKVNSIQMLDSLRSKSTRALELVMHPALINHEVISFFSKHVKKNGGSTAFKLKLRDYEKNYDIELNGGKGIEISDELAQYLLEHEEIGTKVVIAGEG
jgi:DNA polymerase-3 subunit alpha